MQETCSKKSEIFSLYINLLFGNSVLLCINQEHSEYLSMHKIECDGMWCSINNKVRDIPDNAQPLIFGHVAKCESED